MKGTMHIQDQTGHSTIEWDTDVKTGPLDPKVAEEKFNEMVRAGCFAFATTDGVHEQVRTFDPNTMPKVTITGVPRGG